MDYWESLSKKRKASYIVLGISIIMGLKFLGVFLLIERAIFGYW